MTHTTGTVHPLRKKKKDSNEWRNMFDSTSTATKPQMRVPYCDKDSAIIKVVTIENHPMLPEGNYKSRCINIDCFLQPSSELVDNIDPETSFGTSLQAGQSDPQEVEKEELVAAEASQCCSFESSSGSSREHREHRALSGSSSHNTFGSPHSDNAPHLP